MLNWVDAYCGGYCGLFSCLMSTHGRKNSCSLVPPTPPLSPPFLPPMKKKASFIMAVVFQCGYTCRMLPWSPSWRCGRYLRTPSNIFFLVVYLLVYFLLIQVVFKLYLSRGCTLVFHLPAYLGFLAVRVYHKKCFHVSEDFVFRLFEIHFFKCLV